MLRTQSCREGHSPWPTQRSSGASIPNKNADSKDHPRYIFRQFKLPEIMEMGIKIPLIAYSSVYYDEKAKIFRFCGSSLPEGLEDELFKLSPHYFIVYATFHDVKKK